jgi:hypothetical protein
MNPWMIHLAGKMLQNDRKVLDVLIASNPFKYAGTNVVIFKNILAKKYSRKKNLARILASFAQTTAGFCKQFDQNIVFLEKGQFFRRKLAKIAENINPWTT